LPEPTHREKRDEQVPAEVCSAPEETNPAIVSLPAQVQIKGRMLNRIHRQ